MSALKIATRTPDLRRRLTVSGITHSPLWISAQSTRLASAFSTTHPIEFPRPKPTHRKAANPNAMQDPIARRPRESKSLANNIKANNLMAKRSECALVGGAEAIRLEVSDQHDPKSGQAVTFTTASADRTPARQRS